MITKDKSRVYKDSTFMLVLYKEEEKWQFFHIEMGIILII